MIVSGSLAEDFRKGATGDNSALKRIAAASPAWNDGAGRHDERMPVKSFHEGQTLGYMLVKNAFLRPVD